MFIEPLILSVSFSGSLDFPGRSMSQRASKKSWIPMQRWPTSREFHQGLAWLMVPFEIDNDFLFFLRLARWHSFWTKCAYKTSEVLFRYITHRWSCFFHEEDVGKIENLYGAKRSSSSNAQVDILVRVLQYTHNSLLNTMEKFDWVKYWNNVSTYSSLRLNIYGNVSLLVMLAVVWKECLMYCCWITEDEMSR